MQISMARRSLIDILGSALGFGTEQALVNVGDDTSASDSALDEDIEFLVSSDGQLEMPGGDPPHLEVLGGVAGEFQHLSSEVLKNSGSVDGGSRPNTVLGRDSALEEPVNTSHGELQASSDTL